MNALAMALADGTTITKRNLIKIKPPLIVKQEECDEILGVFGAVLTAVLRS